MARPTRMRIDPNALLHNLSQVKRLAPHSKIMAMVKANAYGCGIEKVIPVLDGQVDAFGVASLNEALLIHRLGSRTACVLLGGVFSADEWREAANVSVQCVIHQPEQLAWLLATPLPSTIQVWIKVDTGMHRLGFSPNTVRDVLSALRECPWVNSTIGLMTHFSTADEAGHPSQQIQLQQFHQLDELSGPLMRSLSNSAAIISIPEAHMDWVRPGIMLYGVSPFASQTGKDLGLIPVMHLESAISAIHRLPPNSPVGYGGTWSSEKACLIGVVPVGYADGYPRHIAPFTPTWVNGGIAPIVGRVSMDLLTIDLTHCKNPKIGDAVELWGSRIPVETIAESAGTIGYELLTKITSRVRDR